MKVGIVGKGGVGKTTLSAMIAQGFRARGRRVLAIDTDSNPNLAISLGLDEDTANSAPIVPRNLAVGGMAQWTPERLIETFGLPTPAGVTLLHAMRVDQAGAGCTCTSHAAVRSILGSAIEELAGVTPLDMEAGLEHRRPNDRAGRGARDPADGRCRQQGQAAGRRRVLREGGGRVWRASRRHRPLRRRGAGRRPSGDRAPAGG